MLWRTNDFKGVELNRAFFCNEEFDNAGNYRRNQTMRKVYMDQMSTTPTDPRVVEEM